MVFVGLIAGLLAGFCLGVMFAPGPGSWQDVARRTNARRRG